MKSNVRIVTALASLLAVLPALALPEAAAAQAGGSDGVVVGRVLETGSGRPVRGAQVQVEGTSLRTLVDEFGRYRLTGVPAGEVVVVAEMLGYRRASHTVTVQAGATVTVDFELGASPIALGELLVSVAARADQRIEIGTDIERLAAEREVQTAAITNVSDLLNARATGVSISEPSGQVGAASTIRIRGSTSLTQDNNPIMYVDGVRVSNATGAGPGSHDFGNGQTISRLNDLNPQDIASIQILKGPTAAALYGSEAAAGVIIIETKKGIAGEHRVSFSTEFGVREDYTKYPDNYYDVSAHGFTDVDDPVLQQWRPVRNPVTGQVFARHNPLLNPHTRPFRTGAFQRYDVSVRGGRDDVTYYSSFRYETEDGVLPNNNLNRYSLRANITARPRESLRLDLSTGFVGSSIRMPDGDRSSLAMVGNGLSGLPISSYGTRPDGSRGDCLATIVLGAPESACENQGNQHNSFDKLATVRNTEDLGRFIGSLTAQWTPTPWLSQRLIAGVDYIQTKDVNLVPLDPDRPFGDDSKGLINDRRRTTQIRTLDYAATASWNPLPELSSATTLGLQYFSNESEVVGCRGEGGFASETAIACHASLIFTGSSDRSEIVEGGIFLHQRLGYRGFLFGTVGLRVDDNSAFGENQGAIWSPNANVSAALSEMPFWNVPGIDEFRLRFAWGTAAQAPAPFAANRTYRPVRLEENGTQVTGISPLAPGNPDLTAERSEEFEVGFDAGLWDERIGVKLTYYRQETRDAIVQRRVAPSTGFSASRWVNLGAIENKGIELLVDAEAYRSRNVHLNLSLKHSTQDPIVTSLGGEAPILFGLGAAHQMFREGYAPGALYGVVIQSAERDSDGNIIPGSIVYAPGNLNDPNCPNCRFLGVVEPPSEQSLAADLTLFGNLRIFTQFERAAGHHKYDLGGNFNNGRQSTRKWAMRHVESSPAEQAMLESGFAGAVPAYVYPADYVRWRELTVGYQLPANVLHALRFGAGQSANVTFGVRNLALWTKYKGIDPEGRFDGGSDSHLAAEFRSAPPVRTFFARLGVTF